jgi:hypothetical protein
VAVVVVLPITASTLRPVVAVLGVTVQVSLANPAAVEVVQNQN